MEKSEPLIRNISDTARWTAVYRARESERPDALFQDPFAKRFAAGRGEEVVNTVSFAAKTEWSWVTRTYLFDQFIAEQIRQQIDMVINLAAGLDMRPYRLPLPPTLRWIEVDLPALIDYKEEIIGREKPACSLERIRLDLSSVRARRDLFEELGRKAKKALIISEGIIIYFSAEEVGALATDLAGPRSFQRWVLDLAAPATLKVVQKNMGPQLRRAGLSLKFAPEEGTVFFNRYGWTALDVRSIFRTAVRLHRVPPLMRLFALLPERKGSQGSRIWSGVCLFGKA